MSAAHPTALVLLGAPVAHSLSPRMHNAALAAAGLPVRYEARHVEAGALAAALRGLVRASAAGNVTVPHKEAVARLCAELSPLARRVGAVNTFWSDRGRLVGDNTDVGGFEALVARTLAAAPPPRWRIALLGAGGSAAAVLAALERQPGASVALHARTRGRAVALARRFAPLCTVADEVEAAVRDADLVVNSTPVGLTGDAMPIAPALLPPGAAVVDLVYRPGETAWVRAARDRGHRASDGLAMLVEQGALAFERWFGRPPDREAMWRAVMEPPGTRPTEPPTAPPAKPSTAQGARPH